MMLAGLAVIGWLFATGQAGTIDGLFLVCSCAVIDLAFGLYLRWMLRSAISEVKPHRVSAAADASARRATSEARAAAIPQNAH